MQRDGPFGWSLLSFPGAEQMKMFLYFRGPAREYPQLLMEARALARSQTPSHGILTKRLNSLPGGGH